MSPQDTDFARWAMVPSNWAPQLAEGVSVSHHIANGGQGLVFSGHVGNARAAVKLYYPGQVTRRVQREIDALSQIRCATIVRLLWSGTVSYEGTPVSVVATDFVEGTTLSAHLQEAGPLSDLDVGRLIADVAIAIDNMWRLRIVHRDIKPDNIMLSSNGSVCIIDLGLARHIGRSSLTAQGMTWGTVGYLSPEQVRGVRQLTCKSDVYSLGVCAIQAAAGHHPSYRDQLRLLAMHLHEALPSSLSRCRHRELIQSMVHPRASRRPLPARILAQLAVEGV